MLNEELYFEWYVVGCGFKNGHLKDARLKEINLHDYLMGTRIFIFDNENIFL